ncbi:MAG: TolC family protein [Bacteroidia bacterium]|nr:TolC family protein [Bacteroidia bacterium]
MIKKNLVLVCLLCICLLGLQAQDTLTLSSRQTDSLFLKNNLLLVAQQYKMEASQGLVKQAKLWDNPTVNTEWNLYNPAKSKYFDVGKNGEKIIAVEQLISIAGKRNKRIAIAKANAKFTEFEFYDLMRTLKFELRDNFQTVFFNSITIGKYNDQLLILDTIIQALSFQNKKGNIPLKEVLRLKAVYHQLYTDRSELMFEYLDAEKNLQTLLQTSKFIKPVFNGNELAKYTLRNLSSDTLIKLSLDNRPDLKMAQSMLDQSLINYSLQKRLNAPDLRLGGIYDQSGSYVNNYTGLTLGLDLPVWNQNQGNIKYARATIKQLDLMAQNKSYQVQNEVIASYYKLKDVENQFRQVDIDFAADFELINNGFVSNFRRRNISMLEFVDFFEAYNASLLQLNKLNEKRIHSYEELNYTIGEELFK